VTRYRARISGPLLDRIDLHVPVPSVPFRELDGGPSGEGEGSAAVRERVVRSREAQRERFRNDEGLFANGQMGPSHLRRHCRVAPDVARMLQQALDHLKLSARAYHRLLKVARTIADLDGCDAIGERHAREALYYRTLDRLP
jgi:magnesium chelatase family protein